jgi:flagellar protein FliS
MAINAALTYKNNMVGTATPAELTLMLYDGAIKFCNMALAGINEKNYYKSNINIIKTEKIITHLRSTLDFRYPVAEHFDRIYDYLYGRLVEANMRKDRAILEECLEHLRGIRDMWAQIMKLVK